LKHENRYILIRKLTHKKHLLSPNFCAVYQFIFSLKHGKKSVRENRKKLRRKKIKKEKKLKGNKLVVGVLSIAILYDIYGATVEKYFF
jgi:hypothetical protein